MAVRVPAAVERLVTADVAAEIAGVFTDQPVYPGRIEVDSPGVDPVVLVGGELLDAGDATVRYADSVQDFIAARRWDGWCLASSPLLQAQAPELESSALGRLRALLAPAVATAGWPGARQYRFEGPDGARVLLWSLAGQCDWWISAAAREPLRALVAGLLDLPGLSAALSPCDDEGARVLDQLLDSPR